MWCEAVCLDWPHRMHGVFLSAGCKSLFACRLCWEALGENRTELHFSSTPCIFIYICVLRKIPSDLHCQQKQLYMMNSQSLLYTTSIYCSHMIYSIKNICRRDLANNFEKLIHVKKAVTKFNYKNHLNQLPCFTWEILYFRTLSFQTVLFSNLS